MALVSVIIPVYDVENYIHRCVDSVISQTYKNFDMVLVDDGSPDNCGIICDEYASRDRRIHVIHQENGGLSSARNAGIEWSIENSNSRWITFIDSDDWVHPLYLERLLIAAKKYRTDVVVGGYELTRGEDLPAIGSENSVMKAADKYYLEHTVNATVAWGKLYKKKCFNKIRFPEGKIHEDEFTTYRILFKQKRIAVVEQAIYAYFCNDRGITHSKWTVKRLDILDAFFRQMLFFIRMRRYEHAKLVFKRVVTHSIKYKQYIQRSQDLSCKDKTKYVRKLKINMINLLLRYWLYHICWFCEDKQYRQVYKEAFMEFKSVRMLRNIMKKQR